MKTASRPLLLLLLSSALHVWAADGPPPAFVGPGMSSEELAALPQSPGAKGMQDRHYRFEEAGRQMGYDLYVPQNYDPAKGAPLVVALHGYGVNHDFFFGFVPELPQLCEQYGFICVAPMGYTISGWYGV